MKKSAPRIPAISPENFTVEQKDLVGDWSALNFSRVIVNHPDLYRVFIPFIAKLIGGSELPPRDREILCLRALALCKDIYETHHHVLISQKAGLSDAEIEAVKTGGAGLGAFDKVLIKAADELVRNHFIGDETWADLADHYTTKQLMEVVALVGCYTLMGMATRSFGIEIEQDPEEYKRLAEIRKYT